MPYNKTSPKYRAYLQRQYAKHKDKRANETLEERELRLAKQRVYRKRHYQKHREETLEQQRLDRQDWSDEKKPVSMHDRGS